MVPSGILLRTCGIAVAAFTLAIAVTQAYCQAKPTEDELLLEAQAAMNEEDWRTLEILSDDGLKLNPENEVFWAYKGIAALNLDRAAEAERALTRAVQLDPKWAAAYDFLCKAQRLQGKSDDAIASGRKAIELDPTMVSAYNNIGIAYSDKGMDAEAIVAFEKSIELDPKVIAPRISLGYTYNKLDRYDDAIKVLAKAVELAPNEALALYQLANSYFYKREYKAAIPLYKEAIKAAPELAPAYDAMAKCHRDLGETAEAIRLFEQYVKLVPDDKDAAAELEKLRKPPEKPVTPPDERPVTPPDTKPDTTPDEKPDTPPARPLETGTLFPVVYRDKHSDGRDIDMWGYIDGGGAVVIKRLNRARRFSEGLAEAVPYIEGNFDNDYGYIDTGGKWVVKPAFSETNPFFCGLAAVQPKGQYKWGYIDKTGNFAIAPQYEQAESFSCDIARINNGDGYKYIDKTGKLLFTELGYKTGDTFSDGLACVQIPLPPEKQAEYEAYSKSVYIDTTGKVVIDKKFRRTMIFTEGLAYVTFEEGGTEKTGYMDKTGKLAIDLTGKFTDGRPFSDGMAAVRGNENIKYKWGYIDKTGKLVVELKYSEYSDGFHEGLACVVLSEPIRVGYIDKTGAEVIPPVEGSTSRFGEPDWLFSTHGGSFRGGLANYLGNVIDKSGKIVHQAK
ncbi:MAG: WG repeat-containing protein [Planctomycetota bacterium]|nr:WG repeat-containing protein [Planctomycetota bacterium]